MALKVTVLSGNAVIDGTDDVVLNNAVAKFNTFIDYAFDNAGYTIGAGHPIADAAAAGVATLPTNTFSVCVGYLDQGGNQAGLTVDSFFDIFFTLGTGDSVIKVEADTLRGGIVGDKIVASNLPLQATLTNAVAETIMGTAVVAKTTAAPAIATRVNGGRVETFTASGVASSLGHALEYQWHR